VQIPANLLPTFSRVAASIHNIAGFITPTSFAPYTHIAAIVNSSLLSRFCPTVSWSPALVFVWRFTPSPMPNIVLATASVTHQESRISDSLRLFCPGHVLNRNYHHDLCRNEVSWSSPRGLVSPRCTCAHRSGYLMEDLVF